MRVHPYHPQHHPRQVTRAPAARRSKRWERSSDVGAATIAVGLLAVLLLWSVSDEPAALRGAVPAPPDVPEVSVSPIPRLERKQPAWEPREVEPLPPRARARRPLTVAAPQVAGAPVGIPAPGIAPAALPPDAPLAAHPGIARRADVRPTLAADIGWLRGAVAPAASAEQVVQLRTDAATPRETSPEPPATPPEPSSPSAPTPPLAATPAPPPANPTVSTGPPSPGAGPGVRGPTALPEVVATHPVRPPPRASGPAVPPIPTLFPPSGMPAPEARPGTGRPPLEGMPGIGTGPPALVASVDPAPLGLPKNERDVPIALAVGVLELPAVASAPGSAPTPGAKKPDPPPAGAWRNPPSAPGRSAARTVPEPGTAGLIALGLLILGMRRR